MSESSRGGAGALAGRGRGPHPDLDLALEERVILDMEGVLGSQGAQIDPEA